VALPLIDSSPMTLGLSSFLVGLFTPGLAGAVSSFAMKIAGESQHKKYWARLTFSFATTQAVIGFLMVFALTSHGSYHPLFAISAIALFVSAICIAGIHSHQPGARLAFSAARDQFP
jgi:heme A synthase